MDEEYDKLKTKVLRYVLYKKRTENEVRQKFAENTGNILENIIEYLKQEDYINDGRYIEKSVNEFKALKNMSIKEVKYKLISKGIKLNLIDDYIYNNKESLLEYEIASAKNILIKKANMLEQNEIIEYLNKKGYMRESINIALEDLT
ncbi:MAG: RecX family transcriptional regulator [Clostridiales bacterium]|nr:RecX family transcriptional regulator [Clostridiales bacterium]